MLAIVLALTAAQITAAPPKEAVGQGQPMCKLTGQVSLDDVVIPNSLGPRLRLLAYRTTTILTPERATTITTSGVEMRVVRPLKDTLLAVKRRLQFAKGRGRIRRETRLRPVRVEPGAKLRVGVLVGFDERPLVDLTLPCRKLRLSDAGPEPRSSNYLDWPEKVRFWTRGPLQLFGRPGPTSAKTSAQDAIALTRAIPVRLQRESGDWRYVGGAWADDTKFFGWVRAADIEQRSGVTGGPARGLCGVMKTQPIRRVTLKEGAQLLPVDGPKAFASASRGGRGRVRAYVFDDVDPAMLRVTTIRAGNFSLWASGTPPCAAGTAIARVKRTDVY